MNWPATTPSTLTRIAPVAGLTGRPVLAAWDVSGPERPGHPDWSLIVARRDGPARQHCI